jgi:hypothetical protein
MIIGFTAETTIYQNEVKCHVNENDFNYSQNPTMLLPTPAVSQSAYYTVVTSTGTIAKGGTDVGVHGDDLVALNIPIGFNFNFYGTNYTKVNLSTNGNLQFATNSSIYTSTTVPVTSLGSAILPFFTDLITDSPLTINPGIYTQTIGVAGDRIFCATWIASYVIPTANTNLNFQVRLYERTGTIELVYGEIGTNIGNQYITVGIQKDDTTTDTDYYNQYQYSQVAPSNGLMISYIPKQVPLGTIANNLTGPDYRPYATTVGLYSAANELLVVGKLGTPYPIPSNTDMTFIVRWDS